MENELSSIIQVEMQGINIAFEIASKTAGIAAQAFVKLIRAMMYSGKFLKKGIEGKKNEKLAKLSGEVGLDDLRMREGENVSIFKLHVDAIDEFKKACESIGVPYAQLEDFNKKDEFIHIMIGSSSEKNVNYILEEIVLDKVNSGRSKDEKLEKAGEKSSVQEYIDANSVDENGVKDVQNFVNNVNEYEKECNVENLPSNDNEIDEKSISQIKENVRHAENEAEITKIKETGIKTSISSIVDQDEKFFYIQIDKDDSIMIEKENIYLDKEHDMAYIKESDNKSYLTMNNEKISADDLKSKLDERSENLKNIKSENSMQKHMKMEKKTNIDKKVKAIGK